MLHNSNSTRYTFHPQTVRRTIARRKLCPRLRNQNCALSIHCHYLFSSLSKHYYCLCWPNWIYRNDGASHCSLRVSHHQPQAPHYQLTIDRNKPHACVRHNLTTSGNANYVAHQHGYGNLRCAYRYLCNLQRETKHTITLLLRLFFILFVCNTLIFESVFCTPS